MNRFTHFCYILCAREGEGNKGGRDEGQWLVAGLVSPTFSREGRG